MMTEAKARPLVGAPCARVKYKVLSTLSKHAPAELRELSEIHYSIVPAESSKTYMLDMMNMVRVRASARTSAAISSGA